MAWVGLGEFGDESIRSAKESSEGTSRVGKLARTSRGDREDSLTQPWNLLWCVKQRGTSKFNDIDCRLVLSSTPRFEKWTLLGHSIQHRMIWTGKSQEQRSDLYSRPMQSSQKCENCLADLTRHIYPSGWSLPVRQSFQSLSLEHSPKPWKFGVCFACLKLLFFGQAVELGHSRALADLQCG